MKAGDHVMALVPESWVHERCGTVLAIDVTDENGDWGSLVKFGDGVSILSDDELIALPEQVVQP